MTVMDTALRESLKALRLSGMLETLDARLAQAHGGELGHLDFLQVLCQDEITRRETVAFQRRLQRAKFEQQVTLEEFDFTASSKLPAAQIRDLGAPRWLHAGESVILFGPVGVGKTHIAQALGHLAVRQGAHVRFAKTSRILADLAGGHADRMWQKRIRELVRPDVKGIRPSTATDCCRRDLARDLLADLRRIDRQVRDNEAQMRDALAAARTVLTALPGLGTVLAAKLLGHVGDVTRFPTEHHFASYTGTAPLDASSGKNTRHRLNTGGNQALNSVLHIIAVCQIRDGGRGQDYYLRKITEGKTPAEARRALKRRLSNVVYRTLKRDRHMSFAEAA
ncbi:ATP-binding protein [Streptomyces sp. NPDC059866]|uniref:ATP-binding protein n=1 Tax=Streptomyces sp. NPDC059866 TaxID=3346978 RepID=UPI00364E699C